jgi:hypothetical protein
MYKRYARTHDVLYIVVFVPEQQSMNHRDGTCQPHINTNYTKEKIRAWWEEDCTTREQGGYVLAYYYLSFF